MLAPSAGAATLDPIGDFDAPVYVTSEPGDAGRIYVVEQAGRIQLLTANGTTEFTDLTGVVSPDDPALLGEQGLLSMAFAPDFATSRLLYVFYTDSAGDLRVGELKAGANTADPGTLRNVLTVPHPVQPNHNGGQLQFGPDGFLYISTGDGGSSGDPEENAQNIEKRLGKILRIDPRGARNGDYSIPPGNPFVNAAGDDAIWSYGLRNPFRFSFDRLTGDLTIGDVGQDEWEEVDFAPAALGRGRGVNWGWDCMEGTHPYPQTDGCLGPGAPTAPAFDYHQDDGACSVIGGYVVRDPGLTELYGRYLYADTCASWIRSRVLANPTTDPARDEGSTPGPSSFGEDACGRVYVASLNSGVVSRFVDGTPTDCTPVLPPPPPPEQGRCGPVVRGGTGDDALRGGSGPQDVIGLGGDDDLRGDGGDDCIEGDAGKDVLRGGDGLDQIDGGPGKDTINSRDGQRDRVTCGPGKDRVRADKRDRLRGCEKR